MPSLLSLAVMRKFLSKVVRPSRDRVTADQDGPKPTPSSMEQEGATDQTKYINTGIYCVLADTTRSSTHLGLFDSYENNNELVGSSRSSFQVIHAPLTPAAILERSLLSVAEALRNTSTWFHNGGERSTWGHFHGSEQSPNESLLDMDLSLLQRQDDDTLASKAEETASRLEFAQSGSGSLSSSMQFMALGGPEYSPSLGVSVVEAHRTEKMSFSPRKPPVDGAGSDLSLRGSYSSDEEEDFRRATLHGGNEASTEITVNAAQLSSMNFNQWTTSNPLYGQRLRFNTDIRYISSDEVKENTLEDDISTASDSGESGCELVPMTPQKYLQYIERGTFIPGRAIDSHKWIHTTASTTSSTLLTQEALQSVSSQSQEPGRCQKSEPPRDDLHKPVLRRSISSRYDLGNQQHSSQPREPVDPIPAQLAPMSYEADLEDNDSDSSGDEEDDNDDDENMVFHRHPGPIKGNDIACVQKSRSFDAALDTHCCHQHEKVAKSSTHPTVFKPPVCLKSVLKDPRTEAEDVKDKQDTIEKATKKVVKWLDGVSTDCPALFYTRTIPPSLPHTLACSIQAHVTRNQSTNMFSPQ